MKDAPLFAEAFGFFHWIGISHYLNLLLVGFMVRSGLQILSAHPKLYWRDDCRPGSEWLRFSRKKMPTDRLWTAADEETSFPAVIALPGGKNLGMGRHWHFFCAIFWLLNGIAYVVLLFGTGEWRRLVPMPARAFGERLRFAHAPAATSTASSSCPCANGFSRQRFGVSATKRCARGVNAPPVMNTNRCSRPGWRSRTLS